MKQLVVAGAAVIVAVALGAAPALAGPKDDAKIKALEEGIIAAVNAKNLDAIMKAYVPDESLVVFDVVPPRQYVGAKAYRQDWSGFLDLFKGGIKAEISALSVATDGNLGFSHSIQHFTGTDAKGQPLDMTLRVTDAYRKINGNWRIVHEHYSIPVDLATLKGDITSKP